MGKMIDEQYNGGGQCAWFAIWVVRSMVDRQCSLVGIVVGVKYRFMHANEIR